MNPSLQVISEGKEADIDRNIWKIIVLAILGTAASVFSVFFFHRFLVSGMYSFLFWSVCIGVVFLVIVLLETLFVKGWGKLCGVMVAHTLVPLFLFIPSLYPQPSWALVGGAAIFLSLTIQASERGRKLMTNSLNIKFSETAKAVLPRAFTGFFLFLSVLFYMNYFVWGNYNEKIGKDFVSGTLQTSEPLAQIWVANLSFEKPLQDGLRAIAEVALRSQRKSLVEQSQGTFETDYSQLPPAQKEVVLNQAAAGVKTHLETFTGPLDSQAPLNEVIYNLMKKYVGDFSSRTEPWFGIIVAVVIFFTLRGLIALLSPLVRFFAFLVYKFLIAVGFAYITLENRRREFILLS